MVPFPKLEIRTIVKLEFAQMIASVLECSFTEIKMSFGEIRYVKEFDQLHGDLCVHCGVMTGFRKASGHACCCRGCFDDTGCTCGPIAGLAVVGVLRQPAPALQAAAPPPPPAAQPPAAPPPPPAAQPPAAGPPGPRPRLACQHCRHFVANSDGGFTTCCQRCMFDDCNCTNIDRVSATTFTSLNDFRDAEAAWSDADHTHMVQANSTRAPRHVHKKLTSEQVKRRVKRHVDDSSGFCAICQSTDTNPACKLLCCGQRFHVECIETWLIEHKASCPNCNRQF